MIMTRSRRGMLTFLNSARFSRAVVFWGAPLDFLVSLVPVAASLRRIRLTVFRDHINPSRNVALKHAPMGQYKVSMPCANRCRTGHCLANIWKSEISVKLQKQDVLKCEVETQWMASWGPFWSSKLLLHYNRGITYIFGFQSKCAKWLIRNYVAPHQTVGALGHIPIHILIYRWRLFVKKIPLQNSTVSK